MKELFHLGRTPSPFSAFYLTGAFLPLLVHSCLHVPKHLPPQKQRRSCEPFTFAHECAPMTSSQLFMPNSLSAECKSLDFPGVSPAKNELGVGPDIRTCRDLWPGDTRSASLFQISHLEQLFLSSGTLRPPLSLSFSLLEPGGLSPSTAF